MSELAATVWITVGLTFYGGDFVDSGLACGGTFTESEGVWAAAPIEWFLNGSVSCWDELEVVFANGRREMVPIRDSGCHLHYGAYDTGAPYGADFPNWPWWRDGTPTGTGRIRVRHADGSWWSPPDLTAWATEYCSGPLTAWPEVVVDVAPPPWPGGPVMW